VGLTRKGKGTKWMVVVDGQGVPLANYLDSATKGENQLAPQTLAQIQIPREAPFGPWMKPIRLIADKAYDALELRENLADQDIELICPHQKSRARKVQDKRALRRYCRRWIVERTFAWLGNFRRLCIRWEHHLFLYQAFFNVACLLITL
jgi:transposase